MNKNGIFYALRRSDLLAGPVWQTAVAIPGGGPQYCGGGSTIVPAAFDGSNLYLGGGTVTIGSATYGGSAVALNPSTGAVVWQDPVIAPGEPDLDRLLLEQPDGKATDLLEDGRQLSIEAEQRVYLGADALTGGNPWCRGSWPSVVSWCFLSWCF